MLISSEINHLFILSKFYLLKIVSLFLNESNKFSKFLQRFRNLSFLDQVYKLRININ